MLNFIGPNVGVCVGVVTCEQALTYDLAHKYPRVLYVSLV